MKRSRSYEDQYRQDGGKEVDAKALRQTRAFGIEKRAGITEGSFRSLWWKERRGVAVQAKV